MRARVATVLSVLVLAACGLAAPPALTPTPGQPGTPLATRRPAGPGEDVRLLSGHVLGAGGAVIAQADVTVSAGGTDIARLETGVDGQYLFADTAPPIVTVSVSADGYMPSQRTFQIDDSADVTYVPDIKLVEVPSGVPVGDAGAVVRTSTGAAIVFPQGALDQTGTVRVVDMAGAPPTDQLPSWTDGLERKPLGWLSVSLENATLTGPAVAIIPLSEGEAAGSILEVRQLDEASQTWTDETTYAVVGRGGRTALTVFEHFSSGVVFSKRSQKVGSPRSGKLRELHPEIDLGDGTEDCRNTEPVDVTVDAPPVTVEGEVRLTVPYPGGDPGSFAQWPATYSQHVPAQTVSARIQGAKTWNMHGRLVVGTMEQLYRTEVEAISQDAVTSGKRHTITWPATELEFVTDVLATYGNVSVDGSKYVVDLPVIVSRRDWDSETRVFEYTIDYDAGSPYWQLAITTTPCPGVESPVVSTPTPTPSPTPTPATAGTTFSVSYAGPIISGSLTPDPASPACTAREYTSTGPSEWVVGGAGIGSDGKRYDWGINVEIYTGPDTYKPTSARQGGGDFSAAADSGVFWGGLVTTAQNTITINADQGSGSFDVTLVSGQNSSLPFSSELHLTGTFACQFYRY